jgi:hypothetical protein
VTQELRYHEKTGKENGMSTFNVELKKVVDDSYEIEIGFDLEEKLLADIQA